MADNNNIITNSNIRHCRQRGIALMVTIAVLVVLTTLVYSLTTRLAIYKRRQEFMMNYQSARYACDSAIKYAMTTVSDMNFETINRSDMPDFSDLFYLTADQEEEMLLEWAEYKTQENLLKMEEGIAPDTEEDPMKAMLRGLMGPGMDTFGPEMAYVDPNNLEIPGPYGPEWPYVTEPNELEIGQAKVTIKIRDENAKLPIVWTLIKDPELERARIEMFDLFCQWMQMEPENIDKIMNELEEIKDVRSYSQNLKPITITKKVTKQVPVTNSKSRSSRTSSSSRSSSRRTSTRNVTTTKKETLPMSVHYASYSKLMRSPMLDSDVLARTLPDTGDREESPLKYIAMHGTQKVNINTAPRHVLIAAFTFGGSADDITQAIIEQRKEEPFKDIADFKSRNYGFADSIRKAEPYIATKSSFFAIEITASCGNAVARSVATITKDDKKIETISLISN